jgi:chemotaxis protein MotB
MFKLSSLRRREDEDQGTWFVSLSDMLTLLLCFFVLMLSVSSLDQERYKNVATSLEEALKTEKAKTEEAAKKQRNLEVALTLRQSINQSLPVPPVGPGPGGQVAEEKTGAPAKTKSIDDIRAELGARFAQDPNSIQLEKRDAGVAITLKGAVLFDLASADLTQSSLPYLDSITASLRNTPYKVTVEGHTDNLPIQSFIYPSNWELSAARAARVARYLIDHGVTKDRVLIMGLADTKPLAPNTDSNGHNIPENQAKNRRVVILVNP